MISPSTPRLEKVGGASSFPDCCWLFLFLLAWVEVAVLDIFLVPGPDGRKWPSRAGLKPHQAEEVE